MEKLKTALFLSNGKQQPHLMQFCNHSSNKCCPIKNWLNQLKEQCIEKIKVNRKINEFIHDLKSV